MPKYQNTDIELAVSPEAEAAYSDFVLDNSDYIGSNVVPETDVSAE